MGCWAGTGQSTARLPTLAWWGCGCKGEGHSPCPGRPACVQQPGAGPMHCFMPSANTHPLCLPRHHCHRWTASKVAPRPGWPLASTCAGQPPTTRCAAAPASAGASWGDSSRRQSSRRQSRSPRPVSRRAALAPWQTLHQPRQRRRCPRAGGPSQPPAACGALRWPPAATTGAAGVTLWPKTSLRSWASALRSLRPLCG